MIYPLAGLGLGAIAGALAARARGGKRADLMHWAAVWALVGGLIGLFILIAIERSYT